MPFEQMGVDGGLFNASGVLTSANAIQGSETTAVKKGSWSFTPQ